MEELKFRPSMNAISKIASFVGYGNLAAPVWFFGFEEGLGRMKDGDAETNLKSRGNFNETMDLYNAHLGLVEGGRKVDIAVDPPTTQVWKFMAKIMLARSGCRDWLDPNLVKTYIKKDLGRSGGETFLTELSPIPSKCSRDGSWIARFKAWDSGIDAKIKQRAVALGKLISDQSPPKVICYGRGRANEFAKLLEVEWRKVPGCPNVDSAKDGRYLMLPFFGNGHMSHKVIEDLLNSGLLS